MVPSAPNSCGAGRVVHVFTEANPYHGDAIIAFVDLLGFSRHVRANWKKEPSPLGFILSLKRELERAGLLTVEFETVERRAQVTTMSDSIVVTAPVEREDPYTFYAAYWAVWSACENCMAMAIDAGFMVRGGLELGAIYRAGAEIIGPGFIDTYTLESRVADVARIVIGPEALDYMRLHQGDPGFKDHSTLYRSGDGLVALRPTTRKAREVEALRSAVAGNPRLVRKYDEFLRHMGDDGKLLTNGQLRTAAALTRRAIREASQQGKR
jgi:hypothetical protein